MREEEDKKNSVPQPHQIGMPILASEPWQVVKKVNNFFCAPVIRALDHVEVVKLKGRDRRDENFELVCIHNLGGIV